MLSDENLRLGKLQGGMEGRMEERIDVWKFTPLSYRTSALWGRCPKREEKEKENKRRLQREEGEKMGRVMGQKKGDGTEKG